MSKAVISNRIYIKVADREVLEAIKAALTYKLETKVMVRGSKVPKLHIETIRNYSMASTDIISIPRGRVDLIPEGYEIVDKSVTVEVPFPAAKFPLRESQLAVYNEVNGDCFINALVGWGKTFTALHIAKKLGQKALVVTHNTMLRDQWVQEIEHLFGMEAGIIGSGAFDIEDKAIVVGNVQTLAKHSASLSKQFGTIIMDEAHHVPASTFTNIINSSYAKYRIALSGTMVRKDGRHVLFRDYFGATVLKPPQSHTLNPTVKILKTGLHLQGGNWAQKINNLLYDQEYQEYVATVAAAQISKGHKVLVIADRVEFLKSVKEFLGETCLLVTGETSFEDREVVKQLINSGKNSCIAGSRQIFSEGISIDALSCAILASPIANESLLEQIAGRIMRMYPNKLPPELIDLNFSSPSDRKQNDLRLGFYLAKGWDVVAI